ncbi:MAG: class I SAM-dependent methyltransferase [Cryomorphaceae bacterium]
MDQKKIDTEAQASMWNGRYGREEYAYGEAPNAYFEEQLKKLKPGKILMPAEGEGRNAVFAAKLGWAVSAFDISTEGQRKAAELARKNGVTISYKVGGLDTLKYQEEEFDAVALIYAHFSPGLKGEYHSAFNKYLKKGGTVILEAFSKNHLKYNQSDPKVGGPKDLEVLYSTDEVASYFSNFDVAELEEKEILLSEGLFHNGYGSVVRFTGRK